MASILAVTLFLAAVHVVQSEVVSCPDQQESCTCSRTATECEFTLKVELRQAFVSYEKNPTNGDLLFDAAVYSLNGSGYQPSLPEGKACHFNNLATEEDFRSRGCSIPMTVDGRSYQSLISINGRTPGPTLVITKGQAIKVRVINYLITGAVSIHWHGLFQAGTPWMDGVGLISQPPIDAGSVFDYIFIARQDGTFWYHAHFGTQRTEGLYGGLVVRNNVADHVQEVGGRSIVDDPGRYTLTVIDWQRESSINLVIRLNSSLGFFPDKPALQVPTRDDTHYMTTIHGDGASTGLGFYWSGLINGRGRFDDTTLAPLSVFSVEHNSFYRFRLIGAQNLFAYKFSIDGHLLKIIATDGIRVNLQEVEYLVVHSGERYDFLLDTNNNNTQLHYWIRAETLETDLPAGTEHSARAILTYGNPDDLDWRDGYAGVTGSRHQCSVDTPCRVLNCPFERFASGRNMTCIRLTNLTALMPLSTNELPRFPPSESCADCMHFLNWAFQGPTGDSSANAKSFQSPPSSYQTNCGAYEADNTDSTTNTCNKCTAGSCTCINVLPIVNDVQFEEGRDEYETVAMVFSNIPTKSAHPIHLHGHAFHVVYIGYGTYNDDGTLREYSTDIVCDDPCVNPGWNNSVVPEGVMARVANGRVMPDAVQKDTIIVPPGGYVVVAFQANNPGFWFLHCHIEEHSVRGMALLLQEYPSAQHRAPPSGINLHGSFIWSIQDFTNMQLSATTCSELDSESDDNVSIPKAGFGIMLVIILLLAIACIVLIVFLVISCVKKSYSGNEKAQSSGKDIELS